jgi:hypothetical protein
MMPLHALAGLVVCLAQPPGEPQANVPEGIYALPCRVVAVRGKDLLVTADWRGAQDKPLRLRTTDQSHFTVFDLVPGGAQPETVRKPIRLADLKPGQKVSVIAYFDGKEARLLSAVATGPHLGGEDVPRHVAALGGKIRQLPAYPKGKGPVLWSVDLSGTKAGDADLIVLARLPELSSLNLAFTAVTDAGLKHLRKLQHLSDLNLTGTKVTDAAVKSLLALRALYTLSVPQTAITKDGTDQLVSRFPYLRLCRIAAGEKAHFRIFETYTEGKLQQKDLMIGDTMFAIAFPHARPEPGRDYDPGRLATTYYHRKGPVGQVLAKFNWFWAFPGPDRHHADARLPASAVALCAGVRGLPGGALAGLWSQPAVAVLRLNAGTHACYAQPYQTFDFYDNAPAIQQFSVPRRGQPRGFDSFHDALVRGANVRLLKGEERATLARKGPKRFYSALFAESTREDLRDVNTALMTVEGMKDLMESLREDGILCFHTSHRYYDLLLPLTDAAKHLGYAWKVARDDPYRPDGTRTDQDEEHFGSDWFVVARKAEYLDHLRDQGTVTWSVPAATGRHLWRDGWPVDLKKIERKK